MSYQQIIAKCWVALLEVDWELKQWRIELDEFVAKVA